MKKTIIIFVLGILLINSFSLSILAEDNTRDIKSIIIRLTQEFRSRFLQKTINNNQVKKFNSKVELINYLYEIIKRDIVKQYVNNYYYEKNGNLYLIAKDAPIWLYPDLPFQIKKIDNNTYLAIQKNQTALHGKYTLKVFITRVNNRWKITDYDVDIRRNNKPKAPLGTVTYTIKSGDTLYEIANRFNTTVSNIMKFNRIYNPNIIFPDNKLTIPESPPEAIIYIVKKGDTLYDIAQKYGTQVHTIVEFNYLKNPELIYPKQNLVVPVSLKGKK